MSQTLARVETKTDIHLDVGFFCNVSYVGRNKRAQFRQPDGKRTVAMPELRKLVPAYGRQQFPSS